MKRFFLVLAVGVLMAVMLVAMAAPAFAAKPQNPGNQGCKGFQGAALQNNGQAFQHDQGNAAPPIQCVV